MTTVHFPWTIDKQIAVCLSRIGICRFASALKPIYVYITFLIVRRFWPVFLLLNASSSDILSTFNFKSILFQSCTVWVVTNSTSTFNTQFSYYLQNHSLIYQRENCRSAINVKIGICRWLITEEIFSYIISVDCTRDENTQQWTLLNYLHSDILIMYSVFYILYSRTIMHINTYSYSEFFCGPYYYNILSIEVSFLICSRRIISFFQNNNK